MQNGGPLTAVFLSSKPRSGNGAGVTLVAFF
jgi:hypothetical protein